MRKFDFNKLWLFSVISMIFLLVCLPVCAKEGTADGFTYNVKSDGTAEITAFDLSGDIVIPSSVGGYKVTSLASRLFYGYSGITSVSIPATITYFGDDPNDNMWDYVFSYCYDLKKITVASNNPVFCSVDGILFSKDKKMLINYPAAKAGSVYHVPANTDVLCCTSFARSQNLRSVYLNGADTYWMTYTFFGDSDLTVYYLPGGYSETRADMFRENGLVYESDHDYCKFRAYAKMTSMSILTSSGRSVNGKTLAGSIGKSYSYTVTVKPSNASTAVTWKSSRTSVATITSAGKATCKAAGSAKITAAAKDASGVTVGFTLKCEGPKMTSMSILTPSGKIVNDTTLKGNVGKSYTYRISPTPSDASAAVTWKSSQTTVAVITSAGKATCKAAGKTKITAAAKDGSGVTAGFTLKCIAPKMTSMSIVTPGGKTVNGTTLKGRVGKSYTYTIVPKPSNASAAVTWKSSKTTVATITSAGKAVCRAAGKTKITATAKDGSGVSAGFILKCVN